MDFFPRRRTHPGKRTASTRRPPRPMEARATGSDRRSGSAGDETCEHTRTELLEFITRELRKSWVVAREAGAGDEELRQLLETRRRKLEGRPDDPDA